MFEMVLAQREKTKARDPVKGDLPLQRRNVYTGDPAKGDWPQQMSLFT